MPEVTYDVIVTFKATQEATTIPDEAATSLRKNNLTLSLMNALLNWAQATYTSLAEIDIEVS